MIVREAITSSVACIAEAAVLLFADEAIHVHSPAITVVSAVGAACVAEETFLSVLFDSEVEDRSLVSVVDARDASHIALPVVSLYLIDNLGRQVLEDQIAVVAEELFSVNKDLTDILAVEREVSVLVLHDAGQLLDEVFHHRAVGKLEGVGVVGHRIVDDCHFRQFAFHNGLSHQGCIFAHHHVGHLVVAGLLGQGEFELLRLEAHERHLKRVGGGRNARQEELPVLLRHRASNH